MIHLPFILIPMSLFISLYFLLAYLLKVTNRFYKQASLVEEMIDMGGDKDKTLIELNKLMEIPFYRNHQEKINQLRHLFNEKYL